MCRELGTKLWCSAPAARARRGMNPNLAPGLEMGEEEAALEEIFQERNSFKSLRAHADDLPARRASSPKHHSQAAQNHHR